MFARARVRYDTFGGCQQLASPCWLRLGAIGALVLAGCGGPRYVQPDRPLAELATVQWESRVELLTVNELLPPRTSPKVQSDPDHLRGQPVVPDNAFRVEPGCRTLTAKYSESHYVSGVKKAGREHMRGPFWETDIVTELAYAEHHDYETFKPIRFWFVAKPGYTYWVTASFNGDQFLPRIAEIDASGETVGKFLPDVPCPKP